MALARWLVDFLESSPGWPETPLSDYAAAFDDEAFAEYADEVATLDRRYAQTDHWKRWRIDQMLLELADHGGDVDAAITILTGGEHRRYGAVVHRLRGAGRHDEVIGWMDRAIAEDRVSSRLGAQGGEHWLDPNDVATTFLEAGREQDALEVLRTQFRQSPSFTTSTSSSCSPSRSGTASGTGLGAGHLPDDGHLVCARRRPGRDRARRMRSRRGVGGGRGVRSRSPLA